VSEKSKFKKKMMKVIKQMEKEGLVESFTDEKGEPCLRLTHKGYMSREKRVDEATH